MKQRSWWCAAALGAAWMIVSTASAGGLSYPESATVDHVDVYHGVEVADPYRWLEADVRESERVADWVDRQNDVTRGYLAGLPARDAIAARLREILDYERYSAPSKAGGRYVYSKNDGLQNQSVVYVLDSLDDEPRVLFDPNTWSEDGTVALAGLSFSNDGRYAAYAVQDGGSDWRTWRVRDVETGRDLPDEIRWVKFSGVSWTPDGKGFFYGRYNEPAEGETFQALNKGMRVFYHRLGTPQERDVLVYERPDEPTWGFASTVTEDGRYLVLTVWRGTDSVYQVYYKDLLEPYGMVMPLIDEFETEYSFLGNEGSEFFFATKLDAPNRRVIAIDIEHPERDAWREVIAEAPEPIESIGIVGNMFAVEYLKDASSRIRLFDLAGRPVRDVELPGIGSAGGFGGKRTDTETFYTFSSYATPPSIYRYDLLTGESELVRRAGVDFDPERYVVEQVFFSSKDGTRVPMFITRRAGIELNGEHPTMLYAYGGFGISLTPSFSPATAAWLEMGGIYAVANIRGGGEYGDAWHKAAIKTKRQNAFDDFIAAAEHLIDRGYTSSDRLAIRGGSNGGLLVGAAMTQRPELFAVALPAVGVMDMLRFHTFTAGRFWVDDYGSSENPEEFEALLAYSPYHNLREGVEYPATLVTTADTDDRVVPGHSFKFAARLQKAHAGEAPTLIRIETRAGHGAGTPIGKVIEQFADVFAFTAEHTGLELPMR